MEAILSKMKEVVENPNAAVKKYKSETGKKAIGCFPVYCPEEIIHANLECFQLVYGEDKQN